MSCSQVDSSVSITSRVASAPRLRETTRPVKLVSWLRSQVTNARRSQPPLRRDDRRHQQREEQARNRAAHGLWTLLAEAGGAELQVDAPAWTGVNLFMQQSSV